MSDHFGLAEPAISQFANTEPHIVIQWKTFELRAYPVPTLDPNSAYLTKAWQGDVYHLTEKWALP